ncbi:unnamed protein product [Rodentolepis nana]|uniref:CDGSH iron-sulfur domain-containing protein 3, mitochondrial n=1 Tax=Rodentolepis nana TaxID=102285 RepID=A0A0R3T7N6_RODNA|nr:unnamed protein product [Rodentolepis nana]
MLKIGFSLNHRLSSIRIPIRTGRFMRPGSFYVPFSERFDEESNVRPLPHPETPKFRDELPPAVSPKIADKRPVRFVCEPNKIYWWCSCGQSKEQPFCDGHHARFVQKWPSRNQKPMFKPIKVVFQKKTEVWLCTCKLTGSAPFCDGSHNCETVQEAIKF